MYKGDYDSRAHLTYLEGARKLIDYRFCDSSDMMLESFARGRFESSDTSTTRLLIKFFIWKDIHTTMAHPVSNYAASWTSRALQLTDSLNRSGDGNPFMFGRLRDLCWLMSDVRSLATEVLAFRDRSTQAYDAAYHPSPSDIKASGSAKAHLFSKAIALQRRLRDHSAQASNLYTGDIKVTAEDHHECKVTVDCYRQAALLYLYQMVPQMTTPDDSDGLSISILEMILSIPPSSPTLLFHAWILLVAGSQLRLREFHTHRTPVMAVSTRPPTHWRALVMDRLRIIQSRSTRAVGCMFPMELLLEVSHMIVETCPFRNIDPSLVIVFRVISE